VDRAGLMAKPPRPDAAATIAKSLGTPQTMAEGHQDHGGVAVPLGVAPDRCHQLLDLGRSEVFAGIALAMRHLLDKPLAPRCSPVEAGDRRGDAGFIDKDKPLRIKPRLPLLQGLTCGGDVRPVLLGGAQAFF